MNTVTKAEMALIQQVQYAIDASGKAPILAFVARLGGILDTALAAEHLEQGPDLDFFHFGYHNMGPAQLWLLIYLAAGILIEVNRFLETVCEQGADEDDLIDTLYELLKEHSDSDQDTLLSRHDVLRRATKT